MSLVVAIKNKNSVIVAGDTSGIPPTPGQFGQMIVLPNRTAILIAGNLAAVKTSIEQKVMPKITPDLSAAALAQIVQAALVLDLVPHLPDIKGRVEIIVAGIDPVRHVEEPDLYYLDSAQDFYLKVVETPFVAAGSTAATLPLLTGHDYAQSTDDHLKNLVKECLSTTKLRWPESVGSHVSIATITSHNTQIENY
ncbi:MAG TPA: hypothetical protein VMS08_02890 [Candidatus Saccharimonadia bacterium]|nr:hypothetical protein [Candidatus Saccharimonadia bacterium]